MSAVIRRTLPLVRLISCQSQRMVSSKIIPIETRNLEKYQKHFGSLAESELLPESRFKTEKEMEDDDGEAEHFRIISDTNRPYPDDYQRKIEKLLVNRDLAGSNKKCYLCKFKIFF